jgi:hypothetical protein
MRNRRSVVIVVAAGVVLVALGVALLLRPQPARVVDTMGAIQAEFSSQGITATVSQPSADVVQADITNTNGDGLWVAALAQRELGVMRARGATTASRSLVRIHDGSGKVVFVAQTPLRSVAAAPSGQVPQDFATRFAQQLAPDLGTGLRLDGVTVGDELAHGVSVQASFTVLPTEAAAVQDVVDRLPALLAEIRTYCEKGQPFRVDLYRWQVKNLTGKSLLDYVVDVQSNGGGVVHDESIKLPGEYSVGKTF